MGSSIIYARSAVRIPGASGDLFLLTAEGGESNVWSDTERARDWHSYWLGTRQSCMRRIVQLSSCCEGGMYKEGKGNSMWDVSPESYIRHWRKVLDQAPMLDQDGWQLTVPLKYGWRKEDETPPHILDLCGNHCLLGFATFEAGVGFHYNLMDTAKATALAEVIEQAGGYFHSSVLPKRLYRNEQYIGTKSVSFAVETEEAQAKVKFKPMDLVTIHRVEGEGRFGNTNYVVRDKQGNFVGLEQDWWVLNHLIRKYYAEIEQDAGGAETQIRVWRRLLKNAPVVNGVLKLLPESFPDYQKKELARINPKLVDGFYVFDLAEFCQSSLGIPDKSSPVVEIHTTGDLFAKVA